MAQITPELSLAMEKAQIDHPNAHNRTIQYGNSLSLEKRLHMRDRGSHSFEVSMGHCIHKEHTNAIIIREEPVLVLSTDMYWDLYRSHFKTTEDFIWKGYKLGKMCLAGTSSFICFEKGSERGLIAPISECRAFRSLPSLRALCFRCDRTVSFETSIVCTCLSTVFCSQECKTKPGGAWILRIL